MLERVLRLLCVVMAAFLLAALALLAAVHVDDGYRLTHVSGVWMALAQHAADGTIYPELYDGERFGGTRFMPLQFLAHGGLALVTGEYLVSGKLLVLVIGVGLLATMLLVLRRVVGAPMWLSAGLLALVVPTHSGLTALTSIRGDALPVMLQLAAVGVVARSTGRRTIAAAGLLCATAVLCKVTAVWAPVAIVAWLATREHPRAIAFAGWFAVPLAFALAALELASGGRFSDNVLALGGSAIASPRELATALTTKPLTLLESDASTTAFVLPFAVAELALALRARRFGLLHASFVAATVTTLAVMTDIGAVSNHLLDVQVLTVLLVGLLSLEAGRDRLSALRVLVPIAVVWASLTSYVVVMHPEVEGALRARGPSSGELVSQLLPEDALLVSEDARVDVEAGRDPVVLDPFMLVRLLDEHPAWEADLVRRIEAREFDAVVLLRDHVLADGSIEVENARWRREHFGRSVVAAIDASYRFRAFAGSYALYEPR